jgi:outer membrane immunogenic protein
MGSACASLVERWPNIKPPKRPPLARTLGHSFFKLTHYAAGGFAVGASDTQDHFGWTVGGGVEHAFADHWSVKVEYLYLGLDSENYFGGAIASGDADIHTVKAGLNYRF